MGIRKEPEETCKSKILVVSTSFVPNENDLIVSVGRSQKISFDNPCIVNHHPRVLEDAPLRNPYHQVWDKMAVAQLLLGIP